MFTFKRGKEVSIMQVFFPVISLVCVAMISLWLNKYSTSSRVGKSVSHTRSHKLNSKNNQGVDLFSLFFFWVRPKNFKLETLVEKMACWVEMILLQ